MCFGAFLSLVATPFYLVEIFFELYQHTGVVPKWVGGPAVLGVVKFDFVFGTQLLVTRAIGGRDCID